MSKNELIKNIRQLHNLAQKIKLEYGKPDAIFTVNDDICIGTAKVVNLVFGVHGIHATDALKSQSVDLFFDNLIKKAKKQKFSHIVLVVPVIQYSAEVGLSVCQISCAEAWHQNPEHYQEIFITKNEVLNDEVSVDVVDVFLKTIVPPVPAV